jgi:hypothetical protein
MKTFEAMRGCSKERAGFGTATSDLIEKTHFLDRIIGNKELLPDYSAFAQKVAIQNGSNIPIMGNANQHAAPRRARRVVFP